ncbi:MAG: hypothetical protein J6N95_06140 [Bacilli bacterium]|nr:hypothetical protein [Bacilli bacterium]
MKKAKINSVKQINRSYHSHLKTIIKGVHEKEIFDSLSAGKNSYLRLDRLASSSFDKSWIEVIEGVIFDLGQIISNPRLNTKIEGSITPVELARKTNSETVQHLASHTQYIKEIDEYGNVIPSKLLSMYAEDDIHTYENRFIATFVRRLMLFITKRYEYVTKFAELRNEEYLYFKNKSIIDGAEVEIETKVKVSYKNDDEEAKVNSAYVERIRQTREYILYFYNSPFMKKMKTEKDVRNPILQTNIIRKNVKYHHCYEVYRFIETYDRLGVNYKIDENYSKFNDEELNELNRTLFANYITLKGKEMSRDKKVNTKTYKPKILTSAEDEAFIYGPLLEGPIEFARVDAGYQEYLESKIRKDLPLHPTKKEKEYYADEYAEKSELRQDQKQLNDLLKRRQKEVNAFEKTVKNILIEREKARLRLLELEKETIRKEENDLLEAARREIIDAAKDHEQPVNENKQSETDEVPVEKIVYAPTVTFEQAAREIWPQLDNPKPIVTNKQVEQQPQPVVAPVQEAQPAQKAESKEDNKQPQVALVPTVSFEDAAKEIWPQLNDANKEATDKTQGEQQPVATQPVKQPVNKAQESNKSEAVEGQVSSKPVQEENKQEQQGEDKDVQVVIAPSVSFDDAAKDIWPQLDRPVVVKAEPNKNNKVINNKEDNIPEEEQPIVASVANNEEDNKKAHTVLVPTVSFDDAAKDIWPQLNNPTPLAKEDNKQEQAEVKQPVKEQQVAAATANKGDKPLVATVSFDDAANEIWPQLNNPKPLAKEQAHANEPVKEDKQGEVKPAAPVAKNKVQPKTKGNQRLIKVQFTREDGTIAIIYKKAPKTEDESSNAPKVEQPKVAPKAEVKPQPKVESKQEQPKQVQPVKANEPVNKKPATKKVVGKPLTYDDIIRQIWPQLDNPQPIVKEQPHVEEVKQAPKKEEPVKENNNVQKLKAEPVKEQAKPLSKAETRKARKAERKENRPQKVVKSKLSRKGFRK